MDVNSIAMICHEANRAYCKSIGDNSQLPWEEAADWQRESSIENVKYHLQHPEAKASHSHNSWLKQKIDSGWKYGPVKDGDKKEHPCIVPYEQLPESEKKKDSLFLAVVNALSK